MEAQLYSRDIFWQSSWQFDGLDGWCEKRGVKDNSVIFGPNPGKAVSHCDRNDQELVCVCGDQCQRWIKTFWYRCGV